MSYQPPSNYNPQDPQRPANPPYGAQQYQAAASSYEPTMPAGLDPYNAPPPPPPVSAPPNYAYAGAPAGYAVATPTATEPRQGSSLGLILGLVGFALCLSLFTGSGAILLICLVIGFIASLIGLFASIRNLRSSRRGQAIAGLILSIIALLIWVIVGIAILVFATHPGSY